MYGHKVEELEELALGYQQTLQLLRDLKAGDTKVEDVTVSDQGWTIAPVEESAP